jgi:hypothetical protein
MDRPSPSLLRQKLVLALAVSTALALSFWLYTQPELVVMLAEQLWACF